MVKKRSPTKAATEKLDDPAIAGPAAPAPTRGLDKQRKRLAELIKVVETAAKANGWESELVTKDKRTYRYATIAVRRWAPSSSEEVSATYEIACDERIRVTYHKTSFYSWGLADLYDAVTNEFWRLPWVGKREPPEKKPALSPALAMLEPMLRRFHAMARQLKHRHADRATLDFSDEYDVQDLLHAVLRGLFDDVRAEEYSPSYAGGASRLDFLLKKEQTVIETKFASEKLRDAKIGEQLIVDIKRYQQHPDCRKLICFVYDPGGNLKNPAALEGDLSGTHDKLEVKVIVVSV